MKMKYIISLLFFCLPTITFAMTTDTPVRCQNSNYIFHNNKLILSTNTTAQQLFLLTNKTTQAIYINHEKNSTGAGAGWMSKLDPQHWSAIATNDKKFALTCTLAQPGNFTKQPCQSFLNVCSIPQAVFPNNLHNMAFWVSENQTKDKIANAIKKRKIDIK